MPELPEVERVRMGIDDAMRDRRVASVRVTRGDVIDSTAVNGGRAAALLRGTRIAATKRHGKQLAIIAREGPAICIHLGMSGQLYRVAANGRVRQADHVHVTWRLDDGTRIVFRDVRRFGGIWTFPTFESLHARRWSSLGPDALTITSRDLRPPLATTRRSVKAVLLDQRAIAGIGNIYADEACFRAGIRPSRAAPSLSRDEIRRLAAAIRTTLSHAIRAGGSTIRDYLDGTGEPGGFQNHWAVYGRAGSPCVGCVTPLATGQVAQRTTVWCEWCQA